MNKTSEQDNLKFLNKKSFAKSDFDQLYKYFYTKVLDFVKRRVTSKEIAEDLTSDIFEKIYKSLQDYKWQGISVSAWIFRIARNRIIDYYRKNSKRKNDQSIYDYSNILKSDEESTEDILIECDQYRELYNAIRQFKEEDQYLIYYKFFENLTNKEIANIMNLTETNVGTRLHRIRKKLAKFINKN